MIRLERLNDTKMIKIITEKISKDEVLEIAKTLFGDLVKVVVKERTE